VEVLLPADPDVPAAAQAPGPAAAADASQLAPRGDASGDGGQVAPTQLAPSGDAGGDGDRVARVARTGVACARQLVAKVLRSPQFVGRENHQFCALEGGGNAVGAGSCNAAACRRLCCRPWLPTQGAADPGGTCLTPPRARFSWLSRRRLASGVDAALPAEPVEVGAQAPRVALAGPGLVCWQPSSRRLVGTDWTRDGSD
jgi:hypothetical protein